MADLVCLIAVAIGCVLAYLFFLKPIAFIGDILEAIGDSAKSLCQIRDVVNADERSLTRALDFMENQLKLIQRSHDDKEAYALTRTGLHELRRMRH